MIFDYEGEMCIKVFKITKFFLTTIQVYAKLEERDAELGAKTGNNVKIIMAIGTVFLT